ncbi:uncharacterized protein LOC122812153 isoform X2 [Protopterus annectens]|uniref:uncharacterized protein LOC122812153 isoform X2 n=1 Tax=Protopterus annectens TaxID=7888 RepID=UPI001CFB5DDD|nr:uncharacterized protein LOC122812153 isoform X2 [Protopterus annectens]
MADDDGFGNGTRVFDFYRVSVTPPGVGPVPLQLTPVGGGSNWVDAKAIWREITLSRLDQLVSEPGPLAGVYENLKMRLVDRSLDPFVLVERILLRQAQEMRNYFMFLPHMVISDCATALESSGSSTSKRNRLIKHITEEFSELHQFLHKEKNRILTRLSAEQVKNLKSLNDRVQRQKEKKGDSVREQIIDRFSKLHQILEIEENTFTMRMDSEEEKKKRQLNEVRTTTKDMMQRLQHLTFELLKKLENQDLSADTEILELQQLMEQAVTRISRPLIISSDLSEEEFIAPVHYTTMKVNNSVPNEDGNVAVTNNVSN